MSKKVTKNAGLASEEKISSAKYKEITGVSAKQDFFLKLKEVRVKTLS